MTFLTRKKYRPSSQQTQFMTSRMNQVIQRYVNAHNQSGYFHVDNQNVIQNISMMITPVMHNILQKYSEADFHRVMNQSYVDEWGRRVYGFDFVGDWARNHKLAWSIAMGVAHSYKKKLRFDVNIATQLMVDIIKSWGWTVNHNEYVAIKHLLFRISRIIQNA